MSRFTRLPLAVLVASLVAVPMGLSGAVITLEYDYEFSGATPPAGEIPWMTATFEDVGGDTVRLTISTAGLSPGEFIDGKGIFFNFNPDKDPTGLVFTHVSGNDPDSISTGVDAFPADGVGGEFDINIAWAAGRWDRLLAGEEVVIDISMPGLLASDFMFLSTPSSAFNGLVSAAHVQGIAPDGELSGWVTPIPEPATLFLLGGGLLGAAAMRRRHAKRAK